MAQVYAVILHTLLSNDKKTRWSLHCNIICDTGDAFLTYSSWPISKCPSSETAVVISMQAIKIVKICGWSERNFVVSVLRAEVLYLQPHKERIRLAVVTPATLKQEFIECICTVQCFFLGFGTVNLNIYNKYIGTSMHICQLYVTVHVKYMWGKHEHQAGQY